METEELIKLVDGIYKNILDKFNPGARQMINAGKAYLKALHGAAAASRMYVDAISKLAKQAQQGTWGGSSDIGAALMKIVEVYKEIQDQQMNILKAFYVDLLVPLETNLEKDTKVVQSEQKRFLQQHKQRSETYSKAAAMMKKQRKKSRGSTKTGLAMDKELKNMQVLEEEKTKLDAFCEQSLKNAMTQERRRYGFVLERHCSLAKHYLSYHTYGVDIYQQNIEKWSEVAKTREYLPESVENIFSNRLRQISVWQDEDLYSNPRSPNFEDDRMSINSQLRKTKSMDASCLDIRSIDVGSPVNTLSRAKSEFNLNSSQHSLAQVVTGPHQTPARRPKSMAVPPPPSWDTQLARALYAYLSSGENQLSFHEGDLIALIGERNKGWQFGENLRTQCSGWFPLAYTEVLADDSTLSPSHRSEAGSSREQHHSNSATPTNMNSGSGVDTPSGNDQHPARMFGDTLHLHRSSNNAKQIRRAIGSNSIPPPGVPAPVPTPSIPAKLPQSQSATFGAGGAYQVPGAVKPSASAFGIAGAATPPAPAGPYSTHPAPAGRPTAPLPHHLQGKAAKIGGPVGNVSLHSSNDSGFSNDPPPQPEIDYSDDDSMPGQTKLSNKRRPPQKNGDANNNTMRSMRKPTSNSVKQSNSHGNLVDNKYYASDVEEGTKVKVKRTKSFWKFGKHSSDNEILEGMALWKHRDLVDVEEEKKKNKVNSQRRIRRVSRDESKSEKVSRHSRDKSNDSDKTINNNNVDEVRKEEKRSVPNKDKQKKSSRKESTLKNEDDDFDNIYERKPSKFDDQFYDDDGDGLMLKTVNRKNILQQYSDDISVRSDSGSDVSSDGDDPYDCIVVDDQKVKKEKKDADFPNVAELGKKLEKLSKNSKYSPNKEVRERNERNSEHQQQMLDIERDEVIQYNERNRSFKTFKQNDENGEEERIDYTQERRRKQAERNAKNGSSERKNRPSYESIESEQNSNSKKIKEHVRARRDKMKYYDSTNDELSDVGDNKQFLPRTKLTKMNSNSSKYEPEVSLMEYGETLQRRLKNPEYNSKFDEKSPHNGNMYGPWYDLWGLDSSSRK